MTKTVLSNGPRPSPETGTPAARSPAGGLIQRLFRQSPPAEEGAGQARPMLGAWLLFVIALPHKNADARMKVLRTLESLGAGSMREGVFVLPDLNGNPQSLETLGQFIRENDGAADIIRTQSADTAQESRLRKLFDRHGRYVELLKTLHALDSALGMTDSGAIARSLRNQQEKLEALATSDYFPGAIGAQARAEMAALEEKLRGLIYPDQNEDMKPLVGPRDPFFRRTWATRAPLWADRLASLWLIRRFIDPEAQLRLLSRGEIPDLGSELITIGFEGAQFGNSTRRLTYEQLLAHFQLESDPALSRIAPLVKALETGVGEVPEVSSIQAMLHGARRRAKTDQELVSESEKTFDLLYETYLKQRSPQSSNPI
jgi:hypothetical protein